MNTNQREREAFTLRAYALSRINEAPLSWCHIRHAPDLCH
jgi:hypothetical protein